MRLRRETGGPVFTVDFTNNVIEPAVITAGLSADELCGLMYTFKGDSPLDSGTMDGVFVISSVYYVYGTLFLIYSYDAGISFYYNADTGELSFDQPEIPSTFVVNEDYTVTPSKTFAGVPINTFLGKTIKDGENTYTIISDMLPYPEPTDGIYKLQYTDNKVFVYDKNTGKLYAEPYAGE